MLHASEIFSKFIFWTENVIYVLFMLAYELALAPFIYVRVIYNIMRLAGVLNMLILIPLWLVIGLFYLLYGVFKDMFYFFKILCDYKDEDD